MSTMTDLARALRNRARQVPRLLVGALLLVPVAASAAEPPAGSSPSPETPESAGVELEPSLVDVGVVPRAERATAVFEIRNEGDHEVEVAGVEGAPGLEVQSFDHNLPPGVTREIRVTLDGAKVNGAVELPVQVRLQGRDEPLLVGVKAEVKNYLGVSPPNARWIFVRGEPEGTLKHVVWPSDGQEFRVLGVSSPHPDIEATFREAREDEKLADRPEPQWVVEATLDQWARVGPITGMLEARTDHPVQELALIPVSGFVRPIMVATPQRGSFGSVELTEPMERFFHVQAFSTDPVAVQSVRLVPDVPGLETRLEVLKPGREYHVWVTLSPEAPKGVYQGSVEVHTEDENVGVLEIPLSAEVL